jgi:type IX secretion system PorP/SprF family membrane protein
MRNKFYTIFLVSNFLLLSIAATAQQEEQYTQFMQHKMTYNPAYAGAEPAVTLTALARNQWLGLDGAPQTQMIGVNVPILNQKIGVGVNLFRHTIGITDQYTGALSYGYHLNLGRGRLGLGVQGSVRLLQVDFSEVQGTQPIETDPAIPAGLQSKFVPNFGAGIFFDNQKFYLGISVPRLLNANIDLADSGDVISREVNHFYLMTGLSLDLSDKVSFQPNLLIKYVTQSPFDGDLNLNFVFDQKLIAGASYRLGGAKQNSVGESLSFLAGLKFAQAFTFSVSYDATLTTLRQFNSGTIEGVLQYSIGRDREAPPNIQGPRDFF